MTYKNINYSDNARKLLLNGVDKLANAVSYTLGPSGRNVIIGGSIRIVGGLSIGLFKPLYFANVYPEFIDQFAAGNAFVYAVIGTSSGLIGGRLSDMFESKSDYSKAIIAGASTFLATPIMCACLLK